MQTHSEIEQHDQIHVWSHAWIHSMQRLAPLQIFKLTYKKKKNTKLPLEVLMIHTVHLTLPRQVTTVTQATADFACLRVFMTHRLKWESFQSLKI